MFDHTLSVELNDQHAGTMTVSACNCLWHPLTSVLDMSETTQRTR